MPQHTEICSLLPLQKMLHGMMCDMLRLSVCRSVCLEYPFIIIWVHLECHLEGPYFW